MNIGAIAEAFIRQAEIYRAIPERVGPAPVRSVALPYAHDWIDKLGWGSDKLAEERKLFWERLGLMPSAHEISELEILRAWLLAVTDEGERRALLAWARAKAGGMKFKKWCFKVEDIHPETGRRRKDRALSRISAHLSRKPMQNSESGLQGMLLDTPEIEDIPANIAEDAPERKHELSWRDDPAFRPLMNAEERDFSWARKRNERRRQREARRREKEAA